MAGDIIEVVKNPAIEGCTNTNFAQLHNHSMYSILDGFASVEEMVDRAVEVGYNSLALTDHGTCGGLYRFQKECIKRGIKPILGMEAYVTEDHLLKDKTTRTYHLLLIAKNNVGLKNLMQLSTIGWVHGFYRKPRIDFNLLKKYHEGLIVSTACCLGEIAVLLRDGQEDKAIEVASAYKEVFQDDYYIEIMYHRYDKRYKTEQQELEKMLVKKLYDLGKKLDIKVIATNDAHYARKEDAYYHDVLLAHRTKKVVKDPYRKMAMHTEDLYIKSYDEMLSMYKSVPEVLTNTVEIVEKVESKLYQPHDDLLPHFTIPDEFESEESYLKSLVKDGMERLGLLNKPDYRARIKFEMGVITRCGYVRYFLILWDMMNYAAMRGIRTGIGRGSGVGSLVLYVLNVTKVDPIKYGLLFERFLNPERVSPPDVDVDFEFSRRDEIYEYLFNKYGQNNCSKIGTFGTFKPKKAIRDLSKVIDIGNDWEAMERERQANPHIRPKESKNSLYIGDELARLIPNDPDITFEKLIEEDGPFAYQIRKYPKLLEACKKVENRIYTDGIHAGGILLCTEPVVNHIPLRLKNGMVCSQFDKVEVEELGLLKFDILAIKTLSLIDETLKLIKERYGVDIDIDHLEPDDPKVYKLLSGKIKNFNNLGVFQFESDGMENLLKEISADSFHDLSVTTALFRPGPMRAKIPELYCDYKHGRKQIKPLHPKMGEVLDETYGLMIYQENVMKLAQEMAGFTRGQSDTLRKAVGKKNPELLKQQHDLFVDGCVKNGVAQHIAEKIFEQIDYFAGYGFNKSHSVAYAFLSYQCAYLKVHYPLEFMCSLLTLHIQDKDKLEIRQNAARRMGIQIGRPDINRSKDKFIIHDSTNSAGEKKSFLLSPLTTIPNVGPNAVKVLVDHQPYRDVREFCEKIYDAAPEDRRKITTAVFEALATAGTLRSWGSDPKILITEYTMIQEDLKKRRALERKQEKEYNAYPTGSIFDNFSGEEDLPL